VTTFSELQSRSHLDSSFQVQRYLRGLASVSSEYWEEDGPLLEWRERLFFLMELCSLLAIRRASRHLGGYECVHTFHELSCLSNPRRSILQTSQVPDCRRRMRVATGRTIRSRRSAFAHRLCELSQGTRSMQIEVKDLQSLGILVGTKNSSTLTWNP